MHMQILVADTIQNLVGFHIERSKGSMDPRGDPKREKHATRIKNILFHKLTQARPWFPDEAVTTFLFSFWSSQSFLILFVAPLSLKEFVICSCSEFEGEKACQCKYFNSMNGK